MEQSAVVDEYGLRAQIVEIISKAGLTVVQALYVLDGTKEDVMRSKVTS